MAMELALAVLMVLGIYLVGPIVIGLTIVYMVMRSVRRAEKESSPVRSGR